MKDPIYREDAIEAIEHVMLDAYGNGVEEAPAVEYRAVAALRHLPSARYTSYEKRIPAVPLWMDSLECVCGSDKVYHICVEIGVDTTVEELYCAECGIIMRAPHGMTDMLIDNWQKVIMKPEAERELLEVSDLPLCGDMWLETRSPAKIEPADVERIDREFGVVIWPDGESNNISEYGKSWRCWEHYPTEKKRRRTPWRD